MPDTRIYIELDGNRLDAAVLGALSRVEIRESDGEPSVAALRFNVKQVAGGRYLPLDDEVFSPTLPLRIDLAAPGGNPTRLFDGYVTHVRPHFESIESNCYLEVLCMDAAVLLDAFERVASYPDVTDAEAAQAVFDRYRIPVKKEDTRAKHLAKRQLLVQRETDWSFVRRLARRNGCVCYFETDVRSGRLTAHFHPPLVTETAQADLSPLGGGANLAWIDFQLAATGPVRHVGLAIDPIAKRLVRGEGAPELAGMGGSGIGERVESALTGAGVEEATALLNDPAPSSEALSAQASAATDASRFALEVRGELNPSLYRGLLRARRPVLLKNVGQLLAGTYYVRAVRTTLHEGALVQTFVALRNSLEISGKEEFGTEAEEVGAQ